MGIKSRLNYAGNTVRESFRLGNILKIGVGGYVVFSLLSSNGCLDSKRTNQALRYYEDSTDTSTKTVSRVLTKTNLHKSSSIWMNPEVSRDVLFDDGSRAFLNYRTHSWQPFMSWINGDEFRPQPGETYEVTKNNQFVRKVN